MSATILDGKKIATEIRAEVLAEIQGLRAAGVRPGLAVVLVGNHPASAVYVRQKVKACEEIGIHSETHTPPLMVSSRELVALVNELNQRDEIDGILLQAKDVDGFHPLNVGSLATQRPGLVPCTPAGILEILKRSRIPIAGQEALVVGRSHIVGRPTAMLLLNNHATVTVCHSKTRNLAAVCRRADILVTAVGRAGMITEEYVKPGATVIDVGMNQIAERREFDKFFRGNKKREHSFMTKGSTLMGDVHPAVAEVAGAITPVPGGVGPLTIAMLMVNTIKAAKMRRAAQVPELSKP